MKLRSNIKDKYGKTLSEGDSVKYPQYDSVSEEIIMNEGKIELSTTDNVKVLCARFNAIYTVLYAGTVNSAET